MVKNKKKLYIKVGIVIILNIFVFIYSFSHSGKYLINILNSYFILGLVLITFSAALAVFFSGSLNIFLAGFSKKARSEVFDRLKLEDRIKSHEIDPEALEYYENKDEKIYQRKKTFVYFPMWIGIIFIIISFTLMFISY